MSPRLPALDSRVFPKAGSLWDISRFGGDFPTIVLRCGDLPLIYFKQAVPASLRFIFNCFLGKTKKDTYD